MSDQKPSRDEQIKSIWKEYRIFYQVLGGFILVMIGVFIGIVLFSSPTDRTSYIINLYTSVLSAALTVFVIDILNRQRDRIQQLEQLKNRLIGEASSRSNETAKAAIDHIRREGWLTNENGILTGVNLQTANLEGANLEGANLISTDMDRVILVGANLTYANLENANLSYAYLMKLYMRDARLHNAKLVKANLIDADLLQSDLFGADLKLSNLEGTRLSEAILDGAILAGANLKNASLAGASLIGADLRGAKLDGVKWGVPPIFNNAILPDRTIWSTKTDIERFTNYKHPDFVATLDKIDQLREKLKLPKIDRMYEYE